MEIQPVYHDQISDPEYPSVVFVNSAPVEIRRYSFSWDSIVMSCHFAIFRKDLVNGLSYNDKWKRERLEIGSRYWIFCTTCKYHRERAEMEGRRPRIFRIPKWVARRSIGHWTRRRRRLTLSSYKSAPLVEFLSVIRSFRTTRKGNLRNDNYRGAPPIANTIYSYPFEKEIISE